MSSCFARCRLGCSSLDVVFLRVLCGVFARNVYRWVERGLWVVEGEAMFTSFQLFILASIGLLVVVLSLVFGGRVGDVLRVVGMVLLVVSLCFAVELFKVLLEGVEVGV